MKKTKLTINTKVKYTDSPNYQKHFTLNDRIKIQMIISEHRDDNGNESLATRLVDFYSAIFIKRKRQMDWRPVLP